jgi:hypothetical protein
MKPLARHVILSTLLASAIIALVASGAGLVRLLPWLLAPGVPLRVSWPFAHALFSVAIETAVVVGLPVGFGWGGASFVDRGESRALLSLGQSPGKLVARSTPYVLPLLVAGFALLITFDTDSSKPGRLARDLVAQARASCATAHERRVVQVPLVGVTWLCGPDHAPRVAGSMPGTGGNVWFTASGLVPAEDLRSLELTGLELAFRASAHLPATRVRVSEAEVRGLPAWGRPPKLSSSVRAALVMLSGVVSALAVAWVMVRHSLGHRWLGLVFGGISGLFTLTLLHRVDDLAGSVAYVALPAGGAALVLALAALRAPLTQLFQKARMSALRD